MQMRISDAFHALRLEEIELTADWLMMKQEEKEREREERARLREVRRVEKELAEERARLDKERALLVQTLEALTAAGTTNPDLVQRLADIDQAIAENDYRAANIRAGYVYVISNRGAFGKGVVKIGLTRRLEPAERVSELSGASVPFRFDIHAIYFSEDAVTLETELHRHFADRALNQANPRKEFFFATLAEVREVLASKVGNLLEFTEEAEATEYFPVPRLLARPETHPGRRERKPPVRTIPEGEVTRHIKAFLRAEDGRTPSPSSRSTYSRSCGRLAAAPAGLRPGLRSTGALIRKAFSSSSSDQCGTPQRRAGPGPWCAAWSLPC